MKNRRLGLCSVLQIVFFLILVGNAYAFPTLSVYFDRTVFESQGTIVYNYGFEDFTGQDFYYPGTPWTTHGVTYTPNEVIIVGPSSGYAPLSNVLCNNYWTPLPGTTSDTFDMFGLDLGFLGAQSLLSFEVTTNLATYPMGFLAVPIASQAMDFFGFIADPGEFFTGFNIASQFSGSAPAIDNVTLGNSGGVQAIPEPCTMLLIGSGLIGVAGLRRRFKR